MVAPALVSPVPRRTTRSQVDIARVGRRRDVVLTCWNVSPTPTKTAHPLMASQDVDIASACCVARLLAVEPTTIGSCVDMDPIVATRLMAVAMLMAASTTAPRSRHECRSLCAAAMAPTVALVTIASPLPRRRHPRLEKTGRRRPPAFVGPTSPTAAQEGSPSWPAQTGDLTGAPWVVALIPAKTTGLAGATTTQRPGPRRVTRAARTVKPT